MWTFVPPKPNELMPPSAGPSLLGPGSVRPLDLEGQLVERDVGVRLLEVEALRDWVVKAEGQDDLDEAGDPGGAFGVPDVRLDRADPAGAVGAAALAEDAPSAWSSTGSPGAVPVPCAST